MRTTSGVRAYVVVDPVEAVVRVTAAMPLGRYYERAGEAGAAALLATIIARTAPPGTAVPLSLRLEELGTQLDTEELPDLTRVSLEVSAEHWREALALLVDLVRRSTFDAALVSAYRTPLAYSYPTSYVFEAGPVPSLPGEFRPKIELERLVAGYPLAPADPGNRVSDAAVRAVAARSLAANHVVFGVGGGVTRDAVSKALEALTAGWESAPEPTENAPTVDEGRSTPVVSAIDDPSLEGWIAIGRAIGPVPDRERAPLAVAAEILSTRLNISVREVRGLANRTVCLVPTAASGAGLLHIRSGGRPEAVGPIVKFSLDEVRRIHSAEDVIGADELETAKGALALGLWQTSLDGARAASSTFAMEAVRRQDTGRLLAWPQAVNAVTADQVKQAARTYLDPARMRTAIVGPIAAIRKARHPRWPVALDELQ